MAIDWSGGSSDDNNNVIPAELDPGHQGNSNMVYDPVSGKYVYDPNGAKSQPASGGVPTSFLSKAGHFLGGLFGGGSSNKWIDAAKLGLGAYQMFRKPRYSTQPLSPQQQQLYDVYLKGLMNPATQNNAADATSVAKNVLNGYSNLGWKSPHPIGYGGSQTNYPQLSVYNQTPPTNTAQGQPQQPPPDAELQKISTQYGPGMANAVKQIMAQNPNMGAQQAMQMLMSQQRA